MDEKWPNEQFFALVEKELEEGKTVKIRLKGSSMFPLLRSGRDSVILVKSPADSLKPMDVVLFKYCGNYILHRIIKKDGARLLLQGDGVISAVERCTVDDVVGKVVKVCRSSGRTISVDSKRWFFASRLWRCSKIIRVLFLKLNSFAVRKTRVACTKNNFRCYE